MKTILELTDADSLRRLATESNRRLGAEILAYDRIDIEESKPDHVVARVKVPTGQTRRVEFTVEGEELAWDCTCGSASEKNDVFCKHAVAAALKLAAPEAE